MNEQYPFVMGIEFGAFFSGISIAHTHYSLSVYTIKNRRLINEQIPSSLLYKDGDINNPDKVLCDIQESEFRITGSDIYVKNIKEIAYGYELPSPGLTREKLVADYLRCLHQIAVERLPEVQFKDEHKHLFGGFKVKDTRYCVACPREQQAFIGQCFIDAGIINDEDELKYRLDFITESEATAYNLLAWEQKKSKIKPSENYLVCNLGHTTLGISEIQAATTGSLSQIKVVDEYYGEGSMLLDSAFSHLAQKKIQENDEALAFDEKTIANWNKKFASEKKYGFYESFVVEDDNSSGVNGRDFDGIFTNEVLNKDVFEPVTSTFIKRIQSSMKKGEELNGAIYRKIYLTGRYGYESYFLEKLWALENGKYRKDIIEIDYEINDSVSRGAVYYAMRRKVLQIPLFEAKEGFNLKDNQKDNQKEKPNEKPKTFPEIKECDLIVGIDFGTTYSGISYARGTEGNIITISSWPNPTLNAVAKCPSVLLYSENRSIFNRGKSVKWGNEVLNRKVRRDEFKLEYFKLSLATEAALEHYKYGKYGIKGKIEKSDEEKEIEKEEIALKTLELTRVLDQNRLKDVLKKKNITAEKVIIDYIEAILEYAFSRINKQKNIFSKSQKEGKTVYVLTVPAMWNEEAKRIMVEAFEESSIMKNEDSLLIITEPEAAAISYDRILTNAEKDNWKTFLVCDAGGGTVDLVTFRMEKDDNGNKIIRQLCRGDGGLCGSSRLDKNFDELIYDFYRVTLNRDFQENNINLSSIRKDFREKIKENFEYSSQNQKPVTVELPSQPDLSYCNDDLFVRGSGNRKISISYKKMVEEVFDPVVNDVIDLLKKQMNRLKQHDQPDVILLVGGFSDSKYLKAKLEQEFGQQRIAIKFHEEPLKAVSQGAVSYAQDPRMISSKLILQSYAIEVKTEFKDNVDSLKNQIKELSVDGRSILYSKSRLEYFVYNGELAEKNCVSVYKKTVHVEYPNNAIIAIFTSDDDVDKNDERLRYVDPELHTKSMEIVVDMPTIPEANPGERIPFLVTLEVDELKGVTVFVKCERGDMTEYQARPKVTGHHLGYLCDTSLKKNKGSKKEYSKPLESASRG